MMKILSKITLSVFVLSVSLGFLSGCTLVFQKRHTSDIEQIESLSEEIKRLKMTEEQYQKLKQAYDSLAESLKDEIAQEEVTLGIEEKGLVITFLDRVLFDSGKAQLRPESHQALDKVVAVCKDQVLDRDIGIEGHTDNEPIKYSGWKSNWELSSARANSVLHYLLEGGIIPQRLSATGYGEHRPRAENDTPQGRQKNRRVEIVILPQKVERVKAAEEKKYVK